MNKHAVIENFMGKKFCCMTFRIHHYPIFIRGTFSRHRDLLDRFTINTSEKMKTRYKFAWRSLAEHEEDDHWPLLCGPGLAAGTHPGSDNVFLEAMQGERYFVYNSDCVYVNPARKIFAISDPPGITTASRRFFSSLNRDLQKLDDVQEIINRLNNDLAHEDGATLSLIHFPEDRPGRARILIAGDTMVFHGNRVSRFLEQLSGQCSFLGTPDASLTWEEREYGVDDFFIIASDGILSLKGNETGNKLEDILWEHMDGNADEFVLSAMTACNRPFKQTVYSRSFTRFGGSDNISLLLVYPEDLIDTERPDTYILGGEVRY